MYVRKFRLLNYKSYRDSTEIEFKPGFNIITGQNSAGKTALLEALTAQFEAAPHLSELTVPFRGAMPDEISTVRLTFVISGTELVDLLRAARGREWVFPRPDPYAALPWGISGYDGTQSWPCHIWSRPPCFQQLS